MTLVQKSTLLLTALLFTFNLSAQTLKMPVQVKESVKQLSNNEFQLILNIEIDENWKLYVAPDNGEGPVVFSSKVETNKNVELLSNFETVTKPKTEYDAIFAMNVSYLEKKATFVQTVKLKNPKKSGTINIGVEYMTCNGMKCLAPTYKVISYNIESEKSFMGSSRIVISNEELFDSEF